MKIVQVILAAALLFGTQTVSAQASKASNSDQQVVFSVNIDCHSCEQKIKKSIPFERGVKNVVTDLQKQLVTVTFQPNRTNKDRLKKSIEKLGFTCTEVAPQQQQQSTKQPLQPQQSQPQQQSTKQAR